MIGCRWCDSAGNRPRACGLADAAPTPTSMGSRGGPRTGGYWGAGWQQRRAHKTMVWPRLRGALQGAGLKSHMRGGGRLDAHPEIEDAGGVMASVLNDVELAVTDATRSNIEHVPKGPGGDLPERGTGDIGTADWEGADSEIEELDAEAEDAYKGCQYEEIKVNPRVRPDRRPQAEPVELWDCLVTTEDGTVVDCERHKFSKRTLHIGVTCKYTRALTFENLWQPVVQRNVRLQNRWIHDTAPAGTRCGFAALAQEPRGLSLPVLLSRAGTRGVCARAVEKGRGGVSGRGRLRKSLSTLSPRRGGLQTH